MSLISLFIPHDPTSVSILLKLNADKLFLGSIQIADSMYS